MDLPVLLSLKQTTDFIQFPQRIVEETLDTGKWDDFLSSTTISKLDIDSYVVDDLLMNRLEVLRYLIKKIRGLVGKRYQSSPCICVKSYNNPKEPFDTKDRKPFQMKYDKRIFPYTSASIIHHGKLSESDPIRIPRNFFDLVLIPVQSVLQMELNAWIKHLSRFNITFYSVEVDNKQIESYILHDHVRERYALNKKECIELLLVTKDPIA